jgi:uroporphyrinogen-III synthase
LESEPLSGRAVLVTRPREQAAALARLIEQAGGRALVFPAIEIEDLPQPPALDRLRHYQLAVFVSPTAVAKVFSHLRSWPEDLRTAAVGPGTRRELERHGVRDVISPDEGGDSEALLAQPGLEPLKDRHVVIFRGEDGRALLGDTLRERGAQVEYAPCYLRRRPERFQNPGKFNAVTVSSAQGLANLFAMLDPQTLRAAPFFVGHARIAEEARRRAVQEVIVAGSADEQMLDALVAYFRHHE